MHLLAEKKTCFWLRLVSQRSETGEFPSRELENNESELTRFGGAGRGVRVGPLLHPLRH